jgi:hypothetical protein
LDYIQRVGGGKVSWALLEENEADFRKRHVCEFLFIL